MQEIAKKSKCTGCTVCVNVCPKHAITMREGNDGFLYPFIDEKKCINCGLCKRKCPVLTTDKNNALNKCYVAYANSEEVKKHSSSGGIFPLIADYILDNNGIVIGAAYDKENKLKHMAVKKKEDIQKLYGSKYLQSNLDNIFEYIKDNIKDNKILFVGTPCQVAGLKKFIKDENNHLICIDFICHGVPSAKLFSKYINELEEYNHDKLINYNFRDKSTGWDNYSNTATFKKSKVSELQKDNHYMKLFLSDVALRESCYNCNFKLGNKYSDITLGDFWGVKDLYPEMYNKNGVSAIILNTKIGEEVFENIKNKITLKECEIEEITRSNPSLKISCNYNSKREEFFQDIDNMNVKELTKKYAKQKESIIKKILTKLKRIKKVRKT